MHGAGRDVKMKKFITGPIHNNIGTKTYPNRLRFKKEHTTYDQTNEC